MNGASYRASGGDSDIGLPSEREKGEKDGGGGEKPL